MRIAMTWLSGALVVLAFILATLVWRQSRETERLQIGTIAQQERLASLQAQLTSFKAKAQETAKRAGEREGANPKAAAVARQLSELAASRAQARLRRNALNGYIPGFNALNLPPETLARAKELILASWKAAEENRGRLHSMDEVVAAAESSHQELQANLAALLGKDAADLLDASEREGHVDWEIGTDLWDGGAPLAAGQLHALALAQVRVGFEQANWFTPPNAAQTPDPETGLSSQDLSFLAASAATLTPAQLEILRRNLIEDNQYNAAMRTFRMRQQQLSSGTK